MVSGLTHSTRPRSPQISHGVHPKDLLRTEKIPLSVLSATTPESGVMAYGVQPKATYKDGYVEAADTASLNLMRRSTSTSR